MTNIAQGKVECYICHKILTKSCILSYKQSGSALSVLLYFTLKDVLTEVRTYLATSGYTNAVCLGCPSISVTIPPRIVLHA